MFLISEVIYLKLKVNAEITRKFIHISCGSIAMLVPLVRPHLYTIISLGIFFSILTYFMLRRGLLPSVHAVSRKSIGSVLFPIAVVLCVLFGLMDDYKIYFFLPISIMIFSDTVAAMIGINYPIRKYKIMGYTKSIGGSFGFFASAFLISVFVNSKFSVGYDWAVLISYGFIIAMVSTLVEFISIDGWDDLNVPIATFFSLWILGF
jgi:phytol kinase